MKKASRREALDVLRCDAPQAAIEQHIIMPPHIIIIGMPPFIMAIMRLQHSMNIAGSMPSIGFISQTMPASVILQLIMPIIIGMGIGIIMGMPPIIGIMPFIIIGDIIGWPMPPIIAFIIGIMFIAVFIEVSRPAARVSRFNERLDNKCAKLAQGDNSFQESFLQWNERPIRCDHEIARYRGKSSVM